jgi:hypothetical protein
MAAAEEELGAWRSFTRDLGVSVGAWAKAPLLPLLTILLGLAQVLVAVDRPDSAIGLLVFPVLLVTSSGWFGTQRIWYLRVWRGRRMSLHEVFTFSLRFLWRYLKLGFMGFAILFPFALVLLAVNTGQTFRVVFLVIEGVVLDFIFTFVTPALAFTTAGAGKAWGIGMRTLKQTWPRSAWYALVPPLAIAAAGQLLPHSVLDTNARMIYLGATALIALAFKGATAAFYLRHHEVGDDGSVFMKARDQQATFGTPAQPERPR